MTPDFETDSIRSDVKEIIDNADTFFTDYLVCAMWSSMDDDGNPLDDNFSVYDFDIDTLTTMQADCNRFQEENESLIEKYLDDEGKKPYEVGHDPGHNFWLSRNGHGSGFFDEGTPEANQLQEIAREYGPVELYIGDDGKIYC